MQTAPEIAKGPDMGFTVCGASDVGRTRDSNEDAFSVSDAATSALLTQGEMRVVDGTKPILVAISDGMGGENAGEVASFLALHALRQRVAVKLGQGADRDTLRDAFEYANDIVTSAGSSPVRAGMGATLVAALLDGPQATIAAVGDSRAYVLRRGELLRLTKDQNLLQYLIDRGAIPPGDIGAFPYRSVILQAIGRAASLVVPTSRLALRRNDRLLVCSDGLSSELDDDEIRFLLAADMRLDRICGSLIRAANDRGGRDNITVVLVSAEGAGLPEPTAGESVAATFAPLDGAAGADCHPLPDAVRSVTKRRWSSPKPRDRSIRSR